MDDFTHNLSVLCVILCLIVYCVYLQTILESTMSVGVNMVLVRSMNDH